MAFSPADEKSKWIKTPHKRAPVANFMQSQATACFGCVGAWLREDLLNRSPLHAWKEYLFAGPSTSASRLLFLEFERR